MNDKKEQDFQIPQETLLRILNHFFTDSPMVADFVAGMNKLQMSHEELCQGVRSHSDTLEQLTAYLSSLRLLDPIDVKSRKLFAEKLGLLISQKRLNDNHQTADSLKDFTQYISESLGDKLTAETLSLRLMALGINSEGDLFKLLNRYGRDPKLLRRYFQNTRGMHQNLALEGTLFNFISIYQLPPSPDLEPQLPEFSPDLTKFISTLDVNKLPQENRLLFEANLRAAGISSMELMKEKLGSEPSSIQRWISLGLLEGIPLDNFEEFARCYKPYQSKKDELSELIAEIERVFGQDSRKQFESQLQKKKIKTLNDLVALLTARRSTLGEIKSGLSSTLLFLGVKNPPNAPTNFRTPYDFLWYFLLPRVVFFPKTDACSIVQADGPGMETTPYQDQIQAVFSNKVLPKLPSDFNQAIATILRNYDTDSYDDEFIQYFIQDILNKNLGICSWEQLIAYIVKENCLYENYLPLILAKGLPPVNSEELIIKFKNAVGVLKHNAPFIIEAFARGYADQNKFKVNSLSQAVMDTFSVCSKENYIAGQNFANYVYIQMVVQGISEWSDLDKKYGHIETEQDFLSKLQELEVFPKWPRNIEDKSFAAALYKNYEDYQNEINDSDTHEHGSKP